MKDTYDRTIDYLRISVTDQCNLRCIYCMPSEGVKKLKVRDTLTDDEIIRIIGITARLGVRKIRITGGEPLIRKSLDSLIRSLRNIPGIEDIGLTTNGILLKRYARVLAASGLRRVNVSLDSLRLDRYREITRGGDIRDVFEGIREAEQAGLLPVKINMIPIRGINDDEIEDFARLTRYTSYHVRFIEFMPLAPEKQWAEGRYVPLSEIMERVSAVSPIVPVKARKFGPERYYRYASAPGVIGFISPITHHFCSDCNRLRLTSDGRLRPCLFSGTEVDLKSALRSGAQDDEIARLLQLSVRMKPERHTIHSETSFDHIRTMSQIGG
jgi:GTP 3',8-cyclase